MYDDDLDEEDFEEAPRRRLILAKDITEELKAEYVELIRDGFDPGSAAKNLGSSGSQFRKLRNGGYWHDPSFADQVATALNDPLRGQNRLERLEEAFWTAVDAGEKWAVEKGLYAYHPDFEALRHTNLRVSGEIMVAAKALLPHLSDDELQARIDQALAAERKEPPRLLEPPKDEAA